MCQEICSYKLDHVSEVGNSLNTKLNISPCLLLNMFMHVSSMGFTKKKKKVKGRQKLEKARPVELCLFLIQLVLTLMLSG